MTTARRSALLASVGLSCACLLGACGESARPFGSLALGPAPRADGPFFERLVSAVRAEGYTLDQVSAEVGSFEVLLPGRRSEAALRVYVQCYREGWVRLRVIPVDRPVPQHRLHDILALAHVIDGVVRRPRS